MTDALRWLQGFRGSLAFARQPAASTASTPGDGGERSLHRRRGVDGAHAGAVEPGSQARRFVVEGGAAGGVDLLEQVDVHHAVGVLDPAADDPAVPPGGAAGVAVAVEERLAVRTEV